jgi:23S rRNA pseudouridine1911/1915/1917 synthase
MRAAFLKDSGLIISTPSIEEEGEDSADASAEIEWRNWVVSEALHGSRLDRALAELVPEFSRNYLQQLIETGAVVQSQRPLTKPSMKVKAGDHGVIELRPTPQSQAFKPEPMELETVFVDEYLRVINKPAGLVVHPAPGNWSGTLLNGLLANDAKAGVLPRAGIVHRLDKDTSGLMVIARTRPVMDSLVHLIAQREVSRQYVALVHRPWVGANVLEIEEAIGRDPRNRLRMAIVNLEHQNGKTAKTRFELLQSTEKGCWLRCTLFTGRTHQIRVHAAHMGHPLVADDVYGGSTAAGMSRQALHAYRLAFKHPVSGEAMVFNAPLPGDLRLALDNWGLGYNESKWDM